MAIKVSGFLTTAKIWVSLWKTPLITLHPLLLMRAIYNKQISLDWTQYNMYTVKPLWPVIKPNHIFCSHFWCDLAQTCSKERLLGQFAQGAPQFDAKTCRWYELYWSRFSPRAGYLLPPSFLWILCDGMALRSSRMGRNWCNYYSCDGKGLRLKKV